MRRIQENNLFIYRLLNATGRESDNQSPNLQWADAPICGSPNAENVHAYGRLYAYDKMGNINSVVQSGSNGFTRAFTYNTGKNTLQKVENATPSIIEDFTYDACGNQTLAGTNRHYVWDHANRLLSYYNQAGEGDPSVFTQYDYSGHDRISKLVRTGTAGSPIYERTIYIDGIFEYHILENGSTYEKNYVHIMDNRSRIAEIRLGTPFPGDISDAVVYNLEDQIGSSVTRLNTSGSVIDKEEYYPFGDSSLRTFSSKRYRYVGKEKDQESGLYYYGARYYSPWTCRFISVDPLAADYPYLTPYNYAGNKPITHKDIDGLQSDGDQPVNNDVNNQELQVNIEEQTGTYIIVHGAGYDNPIYESHNQGDSFKKNAEAKKQNLIAQGVPESSIIVAQAFTEQEFLDVVNKEYESGKIVSLDIYSHMSNNAINFGGYPTMESKTSLPPDKDYRLLSFWSNDGVNGYNPDGDNEILKIDASNFETDAKINLWGCNAGFYFNDESKKYSALGQGFANHLKTTVGAFGGYSEFKTKGATGKAKDQST